MLEDEEDYDCDLNFHHHQQIHTVQHHPLYTAREWNRKARLHHRLLIYLCRQLVRSPTRHRTGNKSSRVFRKTRRSIDRTI